MKKGKDPPVKVSTRKRFTLEEDTLLQECINDDVTLQDATMRFGLKFGDSRTDRALKDGVNGLKQKAEQR